MSSEKETENPQTVSQPHIITNNITWTDPTSFLLGISVTFLASGTPHLHMGFEPIRSIHTPRLAGRCNNDIRALRHRDSVYGRWSH